MNALTSPYHRLRQTFAPYPAQFELMFWGMLISTIGSSMIWPFLMVYVRQRIDAPLTVTASLLTLNSAMSLLASFLGGPVVDRVGRKWIMVASLAANAFIYTFMGTADSLAGFAVLLSLFGLVNPLYRVGADAMMADLIVPAKRIDAYALLRLSNNLGIAIGPLIGGWLASENSALAFYFAAAGMLVYSLLLAAKARETLPQSGAEPAAESPADSARRERLGGYLTVLSDKPFVAFVLNFTLVSICATLIWVLLPVYATSTFQISLNDYKWLPATNALMVVGLQVLVTRRTKRYPGLLMMALGAAFYTLAVGGIALGSTWLGFWLCMVVMTIGELVIVPTSSNHVANLAPPDMRGRYMGLYGMTWGVAAGIGPVFGGLLNDRFGPTAIWYGGAAAGATSVLVFLLMYFRTRSGTVPQPATSEATP